MTPRLLGVETEYALATADARGVTVDRLPLLDAIMRSARRRLVHLPDELGRGMFLASGGRFYPDCGGHPEMTTPECSDPWQLVHEVRAGERTMLQVANGWSGRRTRERLHVFRSNVDLSGSQATWGTHENYGHRVPAAALAAQIVPHLVSRLVFTGAGGFDNVSHGIDFTLSPRTPHLVREISHDSTSHRGIFHDKGEGLARGLCRLHVLCGESLCSDLALWLRTGTTALVVALVEAGRRPGDAVALRDPVDAMHRFARDASCRVTADGKTGVPLTAIAIQRHYLACAEADVGASFMPPWAGEVCRRWRAVLDRLEEGWETLATSLDWAVKLALFRAHARRRGVAWEALVAWSPIVAALGAALARQGRLEPLTSAFVLGPSSSLARDVARLTPSVTRLGRTWRELEGILALRLELFELDLRFGQLGDGGIFTRLDADGLLDHRVVPAPPTRPVPRAVLRAALVRELAGRGPRYSCSWVGVWDGETGRFVDLGDPFDVQNRWKKWQPALHAIAPDAFLRARDRPSTAGDPVALNNRAIELRKRHQLPQAERALRRALAIEDAQVSPDSPKRPHRRNNLALVLLRARKLDEAVALNREAWMLNVGRRDVTTGRILFTRTALVRLRGSAEIATYLGQLKTLLAPGTLATFADVAPTWDIPDVLAMLAAALGDDVLLLAELAAALNNPGRAPTFLRHPSWAATAPVPLEHPWPGD